MSIINPFDQPTAPPPVEFTAFLATNMDTLLLEILPAGFISKLSHDAIQVEFGAGNAVRLLGDFDYSAPKDLPVGGDLTRLQELSGGRVQYEAKYLDLSIVDVLTLAGDDTQTLLKALYSGDDKFTGSDFDDLLRAFEGNDVMKGRDGSDTLFGGDGDDSIDGGAGNNHLRGELGNDLLGGGGSFDNINGNQGDDTISGAAGDDWVLGGQGNDRVDGDDGADIVVGNLGSDSLSGGSGDDTVRGGKGDDVIQGGDGDDWLSGDLGFDVLYGGRGADTFHFFPGAGLDRIHDFNAAEGDRVHLELGTLYTVAQVGADVLIRSGEVDQLVLVNVQLTSLPTGWITEG